MPQRRIESYSTMGTIVPPNKIPLKCMRPLEKAGGNYSNDNNNNNSSRRRRRSSSTSSSIGGNSNSGVEALSARPSKRVI